MSICPADMKACCDDLCHGGGCLVMEGYPMLERCDVCGGTVDDGDLDIGTCTCGDEDDYEPEDLSDE